MGARDVHDGGDHASWNPKAPVKGLVWLMYWDPQVAGALSIVMSVGTPDVHNGVQCTMEP